MSFRKSLIRPYSSTFDSPKPTSFFPKVTIQIPVYNERNVIDRILESVTEVVYPKESLEIQVIDDSTDQTTEVIKNQVQRLTSLGFRTYHIQRGHRKGYKAGALNHALQTAQGEFIAIFDADFTIAPHFLSNCLGHFENPQVAFVQVPWTYLNPNKNTLTAVQHLMLSTHFEKEKVWRGHMNYFVPFNGTAGIWRKIAIQNLELWPEDCLTEDLSISVKATLAHYTSVYDQRLSCPSELPESYLDLKRQYYRWAKGSCQTLRLHFFNILRFHKQVSYKLDLFSYLGRHLIFAVLTLWFTVFPWVIHKRPLNHFLNIVDAFMMAVSTLFTVIYFKKANTPFTVSFVKEYVAMVWVGLSLGPSQTIACIDGLLFTGGHFERTPKKGNRCLKTYTSHSDSTLWFETLYMCYFWLCYLLFFSKEMWISKPLLVFNGLAFSYAPAYAFIHTIDKSYNKWRINRKRNIR